ALSSSTESQFAPSCAGSNPRIHVFLAARQQRKDVDGTGSRACPTSAPSSAASRINPTCGVEPGHDESRGAHSVENALGRVLINTRMSAFGGEAENLVLVLALPVLTRRLRRVPLG